MSFEVDPGAYQRFMGRLSEPLATEFVGWVGVRAGQRALDVGCGPGALTARLVDVLGPGAVSAVDPSKSFADACRALHPGVEVREGSAEALPHASGSFDVVLAQLVVHFMTDPVAGLREMGRVARPGGVVAACVWDHHGERGPLGHFWRAAQELDPGAPGESLLPGTREADLAQLFAAAGLRSVEAGELTVRTHCRDFDDWWEPFTLGVGPAGDYVARLEPSAREALRGHYEAAMPRGPFDVVGTAWAAKGTPLD